MRIETLTSMQLNGHQTSPNVHNKSTEESTRGKKSKVEGTDPEDFVAQFLHEIPELPSEENNRALGFQIRSADKPKSRMLQALNKQIIESQAHGDQESEAIAKLDKKTLQRPNIGMERKRILWTRMLELEVIHKRDMRVLEAADRAARKLCEGNLRLVVSIAKNYGGLDLAELISIGFMGLLRAAERFNPKSYLEKFGTFATYFIKAAIQRALAEINVEVRVPASALKRYKKIEKVIARLQQDLGKQKIGDEEVLKAMSTSAQAKEQAHLRKIIRKFRQMEKINKNRFPLNDLNDDVSQVKPQADPVLPEKLQALLKYTFPMEQKIIRMRFGLEEEGEEPKSLRKTADALGISKARVQYLEARALNRLQKAAFNNKKELEDFVPLYYWDFPRKPCGPNPHLH